MPISLRLTDEEEERLDRLVASGKYRSRSSALRAALLYLDQAVTAERNGRVVVTLPESDLEKLRVAKVVHWTRDS